MPRLAGGAWSAVPALHSAVCRRFSVPALSLVAGSASRRFRSWRERYTARFTGDFTDSLNNTARYIEIPLLRHTSITVINNEFIRFGRNLPRNHMSSASSLNTISAYISHNHRAD
eukprot:667050-Prymnesium_polylepis.1